MNTRTLLTLFVFATGLAADDLPPGVTNTQDPADISLTPSESLARIRVPEGFHVTLFAAEPHIRRPIAFDFDDRGRLWVAENFSHPEWKERGSDRIVILEDTDHDGRFDKRKVFWNQGRYLTGLAVGHGGVWIGNTPEISFIPDRNGDDVPDGKPEVKLDGFKVSAHNVINNFHWGPDGWLYGAIGVAAKSFVGPPGMDQADRTMITRGIWRYHPYREKFEVLARGMVNPWGADFNEYGDLFTSNTVIAHLWHIVPGMYCQRRGLERDNPFAYGRIQSITDHLHWSGGGWQSSRVTDEHHHVAGGGHAHCGGMIYLGDNWPDEYRGTFFTGNLHGNRINNDKFVPRGSTYVGVHRPDFLFANDDWFRSMSQKYGPDGGVFVSDWHDFGECHDKDGSHRSSGRIYKVVYGDPTAPVNLENARNTTLAEYHEHRNEWIVRHARRMLHERFAAGRDVSDAVAALRERLSQSVGTVQRLRCLWTLFVTNSLPQNELIELLKDHDPHVRRWAVRLLLDADELSTETIESLERMAYDASPQVRLAVACGLPKVPVTRRWGICGGLLSHAEDAADPYLPLMIWYGTEPLVTNEITKSLDLARSSKIPLVRQYIARRIAEKSSDATNQVFEFVRQEADTLTQITMLRGVAEAVENNGRDMPTAWAPLYQQLTKAPDDAMLAILTRIAISFGDENAIKALQEDISSADIAIEDRRSTLRTLQNVTGGLSEEFLQRLIIGSPDLRSEALTAMSSRSSERTGKILLPLFPQFTEQQRHAAVACFTSRVDTSLMLLEAVKSGKLDKKDVSAYAVGQLRTHRSSPVQLLVSELFADDPNQLQKAEQATYYKQKLTADFLASGNASNGRAIFEQTCAKCHKLFGEGSDLAPDLTGSGRKNLDYVLSNLIDPNGLVDAAYRLTTVVTDDGRVASGFMVEHSEQMVVLHTQQGEIRFPMNEIDSLETSSKSMMPEGLLQTYTDAQVRDLVVFLASPDQIPASRKLASPAASGKP